MPRKAFTPMNERPTIICDSREQKWQHVKNVFDDNGILWIRSKLPVGDYTRLDNMSTIVDRKADLNEVESNLVHQHDRFRAECELAQKHGIRLVILIEVGTCHKLDDVKNWINPRRKRWERLDRAHAEGKQLSHWIPSRPPVDGGQLFAIMRTMNEKYGVEWEFCQPKRTGERICQILGVQL